MSTSPETGEHAPLQDAMQLVDDQTTTTSTGQAIQTPSQPAGLDEVPVSATICAPPPESGQHLTHQPQPQLQPPPHPEPPRASIAEPDAPKHGEYRMDEDHLGVEEAMDVTGEEGTEMAGHGANQQDDGSNSSVHAMSGFSIGLSVDSDFSDADSSLGDTGRASSNVSVSPSVYEFVEEFGRTFHKYKQGKYAMPNDEQEQNRLDLQHAIMDKVLGGKLSIAQVNSPPRVLDLGCGTGIWAIEFAEQNPSSVVLGTDLSPIQPEYVPPNCRFEIDDCEDEWIWSYNFDYIHARYLVPFLADIPKLLRNAYENLTPGGIIEFQEAALIFQAVDNSLEGTAIQYWDLKILEGMRKTGREPLIALRLRELLEEAGFVNITEKRTAIPINPWPKGEDQKIIGALEMQNLLEVCHGISVNVLCKVLGWSQEEVEVTLVQVRDNIKDHHIHAYFPFVCIWGQRPL